MTALTDFAERLYPDVPQVPATYAAAALIDTIEKFAAQTWILQRGVSFDVVADDIDTEQNYEVELDLADAVGVEPNYRPVGIYSLMIDGVETPIRRVQVMNTSEDVSSVTDHKMYYLRTNKSLVIAPITAACRIYIELAVAPLSTATTVDDVLWDYWRDAILAGAKARLYRMPGNPWTNFNLVAVAERDFQRGVVAARRQQKNGFSAAPLSVAPRSDQVWF